MQRDQPGGWRVQQQRRLPAHLHSTSLDLASLMHIAPLEHLHDGHTQGLVDVAISCLEAVNGICHAWALQEHTKLQQLPHLSD